MGVIFILLLSVLPLQPVQVPFLSFRLRHDFYRDTRETSFDLRTLPSPTSAWDFEMGSNEKEDWYLDQRGKTLEGRARFRFRTPGGEISMVMKGTESSQIRELFETGERQSAAWVRFSGTILPNLSLEHRIGGIYSSYFKMQEVLSNSGFQSKAHLSGHLRNLRGSVEWVTDQREVTQEKYLFLAGSLYVRPLIFSVEGRKSSSLYPLPGQREKKKEEEVRFGILVNPLPGSVSLKMMGARQNDWFEKERAKVATVTRFGASLGIERNIGPLGFSMSFAARDNRSDYRWSPVDERSRETSISIEIAHPQLGPGSLRFMSFLDLKRTDYPEGEIQDDGDERTLESSLQSELSLGKLRIDTRVSARRQDLVLLKSLRSASTRRTQRFMITSTIHPKTQQRFSFRWEVSALYSIFRFKPEENILLRYLELEANLGQVKPLLLTLKSRWQDQGRFLRTSRGTWAYSRLRESRELWGEVSLELLRVLGLSLGARERFYFRKQGPPSGKLVYTMTEFTHSFTLKGGKLQAFLGQVVRKGEEKFLTVNVSFESSL